MVSNANTGRKISICEKIRENIGKKSFMERLFCDFILDDVIIFLKTPVQSFKLKIPFHGVLQHRPVVILRDPDTWEAKQENLGKFEVSLSYDVRLWLKNQKREKTKNISHILLLWNNALIH